MAHFAEIDSNSRVVRVIVADQDFIDSGAVGDPSKWIQTSFNTSGSKYLKGSDNEQRAANKLIGSHRDVLARNRGNYAAAGYIYDSKNDKFYPPQPFSSWKLNRITWNWEPPKPMPTDNNIYRWNESLKDWVITV